MPLPLYDRVMETSNTVGTSSLVLNGAVLGYRRFVDTVGLNTDTYYTIQNESAGEWEVGIGHLSDATTLLRTSILTSSNNGGFVNLSIGQKQVFVSLPAQEFGELGGGSGDKTYVHTQSSSSSIWIVNHNLNKWVSVNVVDTAKTIIIGHVVYLSLNSVRIEFSVPFSGEAYIN